MLALRTLTVLVLVAAWLLCSPLSVQGATDPSFNVAPLTPKQQLERMRRAYAFAKHLYLSQQCVPSPQQEHAVRDAYLRQKAYSPAVAPATFDAYLKQKMHAKPPACAVISIRMRTLRARFAGQAAKLGLNSNIDPQNSPPKLLAQQPVMSDAFPARAASGGGGYYGGYYGGGFGGHYPGGSPGAYPGGFGGAFVNYGRGRGD